MCPTGEFPGTKPRARASGCSTTYCSPISEGSLQTKHAEARAQQRGIPPLIDQLLDLYGHEQYDGNGAVVVFLDKDSIRRMERESATVLSREWLSG